MNSPNRIKSKIFSASSPPKKINSIEKICNTWIDAENVLHVNCMNGNGDLWWVYTKLKNFKMKMCFHLCSYFPPTLQSYYENSKNRSIDLLDLLDISYTIENVSLENMNSIIKNPFPKNMSKENLIKEMNAGSAFSFCPNSYMERGEPLMNIWPELEEKYEILELKFHSKYNKEFVDKCNNKTVFIHVATYGKDKGGWSDFNLQTVLRLVRMLHSKGYNIGLSGRDIDNVDWPSLIDNIQLITNVDPLVLKNEHISTCIEAVKKSKCIIGPINGFIIIALTQGANVYSLWPHYLEKMKNTILNPLVPASYASYSIVTTGKNIIDEKLNIKLINDFITWLSKI